MEALFGGSFDPVHVGHLVVAEALAEELGCTVRFMPAREQPLKRHRPAASPEARAAMLELAIAGNPRFRLERIELVLPAPSYTTRTLEALAAREPGTRFALILGADAVGALPHWHDIALLPRLADVIAFSRPGGLLAPHPAITRTVSVPAIEISATDVRARVAESRSIRYLVPDAVREYIAAHGLYR
ncbi:MAG TPA: nicotinate-nucleotide adenylyltransferase [Gemmatimonadales bacterium]|nr:nicotinate-nucleotide adenylyltransferase [Gemmatimonadales bacterium]